MKKPLKIVVTGSRGKSSVVRLLHHGFLACGLRCYSRITGVIPRTLTPDGFMPIYRSSGANVKEMDWWLKQVPREADVMVLENSAVSPDFQILAASWMKPDVIVVTNARPDHQDAWGQGEVNASIALFKGVPPGALVVLSPDFIEKSHLLGPLYNKNCKVVVSHDCSDVHDYRSSNRSLALEVARLFELPLGSFWDGVISTEPDIADFTVLEIGEGLLAFAFSANDLETTEELFRSTGWKREDTTVLFNNRSDRRERFSSFKKWLKGPWRESYIMGDRPYLSGGLHHIDFKGTGDLMAFIEKKRLVFGCGNVVYGLPLELKLELEGKQS